MTVIHNHLSTQQRRPKLEGKIVIISASYTVLAQFKYANYSNCVSVVRGDDTSSSRASGLCAQVDQTLLPRHLRRHGRIVVSFVMPLQCLHMFLGASFVADESDLCAWTRAHHTLHSKRHKEVRQDYLQSSGSNLLSREIYSTELNILDAFICSGGGASA